MRWFEFNDLGAAVGDFGPVQCILFADLWKPQPPVTPGGATGACRGFIAVGRTCLFCVRSTWVRVEDGPFAAMLDDEYRAGELFGWEAVIDPRPNEIGVDKIREQYFPSSEALLEYTDSFSGGRSVSSLSVAYEAPLSAEIRSFPTFFITLFDADQRPVLRLTAQPEGRLVCEEPELR